MADPQQQPLGIVSSAPLQASSADGSLKIVKSEPLPTAAAAPAAAPANTIERFGSGLWSTTLGGISNLIQNWKDVPGEVLKKVSRVPELKAIYDAASSGDTAKAGALGLRFLANSASGGQLTGVSEAQDTLEKGDYAGAFGKLSGLALTALAGLKAPAIADAVGDTGAAIGRGVKAGGADVAAGTAKVVGGTAAIRMLPEMGGAHYIGLYPIYKGMKQIGSGLQSGYQAAMTDPATLLRQAVESSSGSPLAVPQPNPGTVLASEQTLRNAIAQSMGKRLSTPSPPQIQTMELPDEPFPSDSDILRNAIAQATGKKLAVPQPNPVQTSPVSPPVDWELLQKLMMPNGKGQ